MNWVKVVFPKQRKVFIDGAEIGSTNRLLAVGEDGTYEFDLGEPADYKPKRMLRRVMGRPRTDPLVLEFRPRT